MIYKTLSVSTSLNSGLKDNTPSGTAKKLKRAEIFRSTRIVRWVLTVLLIIDFSLTISWIAEPDNPDTQSTFEESEDVETAIVHMCTYSLMAALPLVSLIVAFPQYKHNVAPRMVVIVMLRVISIMLFIAELANSDSTTTGIALISVALGVIFIEFICIVINLSKISLIHRLFYITKDRGLSVWGALKSTSKDTEQFVNLLDDWLFLKESRRIIHKKYVTGRNVAGIATVLILAVVITIFVSEFWDAVSTQTQLYDADQIQQMNSPDALSYYDTSITSSVPHPKVLIVVVDGLRYDSAYKSARFLGFMQSIQNDSKVYQTQAQLPSMSVPNWMSILTGAPPESTGVLGNIEIPETLFDSIFNRASVANLERGLTGSPWFAGIIQSTLPFLGGDGTIATSLGGSSDSSDAADQERAKVLKSAMNGHLSSLNYSLFLAHFSDVDIQGHYFGVSQQWNKHDTYYGAIENKTAILEDLVDYIDENTVVFIISDHGHVMRGGHGGIDPSLTEIPLIIYKKNSNFGQYKYEGPRFVDFVDQNVSFCDKPQIYSNLDIAPTVCAILGLPVPRQNEGKFIDDAMAFVGDDQLQNAYYDLYVQKKNLLQAFIDTTTPSKPPTIPQLSQDASLDEYVSAVEDLIAMRVSTIRDGLLTDDKIRNNIVTAAIAFLVLFFISFLFQKFTFCDVRSIFCRASGWVPRTNRLACLCGLSSVAIYYGVSLAVYNICFTVVGYEYWDSTVIHQPSVLARYAFICLTPATVVLYLIIRSIHTYYSERPPFSWRRLNKLMNIYLLGKDPRFRDVGVIYLYRYYLAIWTLVSWLFLLVIQSNYVFVITPVLKIRYIDSELWELRFRVLTAQLIGLPLSLAALLLLFFGWPAQSYKSGNFDPIYLIKVQKDLFNEFRLSELTPENLSKLASRVYYLAIWKEMNLQKYAAVSDIDDVALMDSSTTRKNINASV